MPLLSREQRMASSSESKALVEISVYGVQDGQIMAIRVTKKFINRRRRRVQ